MQHTHRHFEDQLELLSAKLRELGTLTGQAIEGAIKAVVERDSNAARRVIADDVRVDALELEIDEICIDLLALQQPMAGDLRFLTTAMKVAPDLERMADHAVNISEQALELNHEPAWPLGDIPKMAQQALGMMRRTMRALIGRDATLARAVIRQDDRLDRMMEGVFHHVMGLMIGDPESISRAMRLSIVAKNLERIGDQATNICEQVVFMAEARVIKHPGIDPAANRN